MFFFAGASNAGWTEYVRRFLFFIMYEIWLTAFPPVLLRLKHAQTSLVSLSLIESPCSFLLTALLLSMICQNLPVVSCGKTCGFVVQLHQDHQDHQATFEMRHLRLWCWRRFPAIHGCPQGSSAMPMHHLCAYVVWYCENWLKDMHESWILCSDFQVILKVNVHE